VANEYVRICPVCDRENPPERARCGCGASLAGVDFSLKRTPAVTAALDAEPPVTAGSAARPLAPEETPAASAPPTATTPASPPTLICPYADCGQPNPPGSVRCVYCNRALVTTSPAVANARPLPPALRGGVSVIDVFPATGSEADLLLVADVVTGERRVAKLYRRGVAPDFRMLDILAQSVGDAVVRVLAHGVSDGVAYELLEYVPGGTLLDLMREGPLPKSDLQRVVKEIADALNGIHAQHILHRDLKPENVLIRSRNPLELALTDFGIASLSAATQHFTTTARTTKYAAPEALTGVLDPKADWWSLGMIVLEAASGRHPFDGLTEPVMNHHLATRPIDVGGVYDDDLRMLCRGLLLRDPKRRWGGEEVARWLAGDPGLKVPVESEVAGAMVRPYRLGKTEVGTVAELALALARHWDAARRDLARGQVARWLEDEARDYNLVRELRDLQEQKGLSDDAKLLRFLLLTTPELPPVWRGSPVSQDAALAAARASANGDQDARTWLDSLARDNVLATYGAAGHEALRALDERWRQGRQRFVAYWEAARAAEDRWRKQPRKVGAGDAAHAVSFDDLAYVATGRLEQPTQREVDGPLLLALHDLSYVDALRGEVEAALVEIAGHCPWFEALWDSAQQEPVGLVAAFALLPQAKEDAAAERKREAAAAQARAQDFATAQADLRARLADVLDLVPTGEEDLATDTVTQLLDRFNGFQAACQHLLEQGDASPEHEALRPAVEKLGALAFSAQRALAATEATSGINRLLLAPRWLLVAGAVGAIALLRVPAVLIVVGIALALVLAWRWYSGFDATEKALEQLRVFGLNGRTFLRRTQRAEDAPADTT
jgi:hypothetical protein